MNKRLAESILDGLGLETRYGYEDYDEVVPKGAIRSQSPTVGREVYEGDTVTLNVSKGPRPVVVPYVLNQTEINAIGTLQSKKFVVFVNYSESSTVDKGKVIAQNPESGFSAPRDSAVTITVSLGVKVPSVIGDAENNAKSTLTSQFLKYTVQYQSSTTVAKGKVIDQSPSPNEYVNKNSNITLFVSSGTAVPSVIGLDQSTASSLITGAGLQVAVNEQSNKTVAIGQVISQSPSGGASANVNDIVTITVSSGVIVPNVVGATQSSASSTLTVAGLLVSVSEQESDTVAKGRVISQSPNAGASVSSGSTVTIVVSSGLKVPNVVGQSQQSAENAIQAKGLSVTVQMQQSATVPEDIVISQTPSAGAEANPGAMITIVVSTGDGKVSVPNVIGLDEATASAMLSSAGFDVNTSSAHSDTVATGYVISQVPAEGSRANLGSIISIVISLGPEV